MAPERLETLRDDSLNDIADNFSRMHGEARVSFRYLEQLVGRNMDNSLYAILRADNYSMGALLDITHALGYRLDVRFVKRLESTADVVPLKTLQPAA